MTPPPQYTVGNEIGRGALGRVVMLHTGEEVLAGKMLHASHRGDPTARARFAGEAAILAELDHPNLVRVVGLESIDGAEVLVMEYIDGPSLATLIAREAPMAEERIVGLGQGLAAGLAAAHHAGLMHRDLKPANILLTGDGAPKIVDFGLARATSFEGVDPSAFAIVGTPDYIAPESVDPLAVDPRSDIYSLGCILYEMATGRPPYTGATAFGLIEAHRDAPIPPVEPNRNLSPGLLDLIRWTLGKSPADRPQSATVIERELATLGQSSAPGLVPAGNATVAAATSQSPTSRDYIATELFGGQCAACGDPLIVGVPVCFGCGLEQPTLEPGEMTVFVVGPGQVAAKIDTNLRQKLLDWLRANPSLGLDPKPLAERVPRLPFVVAVGISRASAERLTQSIGRLGLVTESLVGGRYALKDVRRKAWKLGGRISLIAVGSGAGALHAAGPMIIPIGAVAAIGCMISGWVMAGRRFISQKATRGELPPGLIERLDRVAGVVPALAERRHRESLRAVVQRVLSLRAALVARGLQTFDGELAQIVDLAVVASTRVDQLESQLADADLREPSDEVRMALRERDKWAARLLEASAVLDALRARYLAALLDPGETGRALADLNRQVEALKEVQEL